MVGEDKAITKIPEIKMTWNVFRKLTAYADLCSEEISALGDIIVDEDGIIVINDIFLFKQVVTGSTTDLAPSDISEFMCTCINEGRDPSKMKFWWHSHVNMGTFWSGTDTGTINRFSTEWMISMVSNKRGDYKLRVDVFSPFRITLDNLVLKIEYEEEFYTTVKVEIDEKVQHKYLPGLTNALDPLTSYQGCYTLPTYNTVAKYDMIPPKTRNSNVYYPGDGVTTTPAEKKPDIGYTSRGFWNLWGTWR